MALRARQGIRCFALLRCHVYYGTAVAAQSTGPSTHALRGRAEWSGARGWFPAPGALAGTSSCYHGTIAPWHHGTTGTCLSARRASPASPDTPDLQLALRDSPVTG